MKKRIITALKANKLALIVATVLVMLSCILYIICNMPAASIFWYACGYLFFITFVGATATSCIALAGLIHDLIA